MQLPTLNFMRVNQRPEPQMVRGAGSYLFDQDGKRYLDFIQGWAVNCLGHSPAAIKRAIVAQLDQVMNVGPALYNQPALSLAARLCELSGLDRAFFANSGAEANEAAVKLCRKWAQKRRPGAFEVITTRDSFHGRTLAMTCATGKAGWDSAFPPRVEGFVKAPYGDVAAIASMLTDQTAAVMVEPIQGEAGAVTPPSGYLRELRALCDERGVLLVLDEVQTGIGRTGPLFAFEAEGVRPDLVTLGKGLGGGLPISALLATREASCFDDGDHGSTFGGNAVCCAAALAVLEVLTEPKGREAREESSRRLELALHRAGEFAGARLRGQGHLFGLVLPSNDAEKIRDRAFEQGLLLNAARPNVLRFMPALDVGQVEIDEMLALLLDVLAAVSQRRKECA